MKPKDDLWLNPDTGTLWRIENGVAVQKVFITEEPGPSRKTAFIAGAVTGWLAKKAKDGLSNWWNGATRTE